MQKTVLAFAAVATMTACGGSTRNATDTDTITSSGVEPAVVFNADSAMSYLRTQVEFGPRVNNTEPHRNTARWLEQQLRRHGAVVSLQPMQLTDAQGTKIDAVNIIGQYNPDASSRLLLLAHWDSRPWADADPDESKHNTPVAGANDGASGVAVLLETARLLGQKNPGIGVDILFVDAEDRGNHDDEDSWALGAQYFVNHPFKEGYLPDRAILLDMVGGRGAHFYYEAFSAQAAPELLAQIWSIAGDSGYGDIFIPRGGGGVTDDHVRLIDAGIPAIDIIEFDPTSPNGFNAVWHTTSDTPDNIDPATLKAVGQTLVNYIYSGQ